MLHISNGIHQAGSITRFDLNTHPAKKKRTCYISSLFFLVVCNTVTAYRMYYLDELCALNNNRYNIKLGTESLSGVVLYLSRQSTYSFQPLDCRIHVTVQSAYSDSGTTRGIVAVVEDMDLRQFRDQANHRWASDYCLDYLEIQVRPVSPQQLCGKWSLAANGFRSSPLRSLVGYCPGTDNEERCEGTELNLRVVVSRNGSERWQHINWGPRSGFTLVVTAYEHAQYGHCKENQHRCYSPPYSLHELTTPHCIWGEFRCDGHQNCGFLHNTDEFGCTGNGLSWSFSTSSILIGVWLAVCSVLLLVILLMLRCHRLFLLDALVSVRRRMILAGSRDMTATSSGSRGRDNNACTSSASSSSVSLDASTLCSHHGDCHSSCPRTGSGIDQPSPRRPTISVTVLYHPIIASCRSGHSHQHDFACTRQSPRLAISPCHRWHEAPPMLVSPDAPPTYESLFPEDPPPNYNQLSFPICDTSTPDVVVVGTEIHPDKIDTDKSKTPS